MSEAVQEQAVGVVEQVTKAGADVAAGVSELMALSMNGKFGSEVTVILAAIAAILVVGLLFSPFRPSLSPVFSGLMISLGILGTFYGIYGALNEFEMNLARPPEEGEGISSDVMRKAVEGLLAKMKVAFVSSLLGLGGAVVFRIILLPLRFVVSLLSPRRPPVSVTLPKEVVDAIAAIKAAVAGDGKITLVEQMQKLHAVSCDKLDAVKQAISGEGDSNLVERMEKFRQDNLAKHDALLGVAQGINTSVVNAEDLLKDNRTEISAVGAKVDQFRKENLVEHGKLQGIAQTISTSTASTAQLLEQSNAKLSTLQWQVNAVNTSLLELLTVNRDGFKSLEGLTDTIREKLIGLLENLITDLNQIIATQLKEQLDALITSIDQAINKRFGKSIDEFKVAVGELNKWQKDHCDRVKRLTDDFKETAAAFVAVRDGIVLIEEKCAEIPKTMEKLEKVVEGGQSQLRQLNAEMTEFKANLDQARQKMDASSAALNDAAQASGDMVKATKGAMDEISKLLAKGVEDSDEFREQLLAIGKELAQYALAIAEKCEEAIAASQGGRSASQ